MQEERLTNEEIDLVKNTFAGRGFGIMEDFVNPEFGKKCNKVFDMAKKLNNSIDSLRTIYEMLSCMKEKLNESPKEEVDGIKVYLSEVINDMI